jgi:hypothetical protein
MARWLLLQPGMLGPSSAYGLTILLALSIGCSTSVDEVAGHDASTDAAGAIYTVGGTVSGLSGGALTLVNDGSDDVTLTGNGVFTFPTHLAKGAPYLVTVFLAPEGKSCRVTNAFGHVATANVTDVAVTCSAGDGGDGGADAGAALYSVGGRVTGLEGASVVVLNGSDNVTVNGDGSFTFPVQLPNGAPYAVTTDGSPAGHACSGTKNIGHIDGADVTDVVIACPSTVATLASLTTSAGVVVPTFSPSGLDYTVSPVIVPLIVEPPSTVTVTATATDPGATIAINGAATISGAASDSIAVPFGLTSATIVVTAADRVSTTTYVVNFAATAQEAYVKPSNTASGLAFGAAIALSSDGNTLAVGAARDSSDATGINGDALDTSAPAAGAVHVFTRFGTTWSEQAYIKASNTRAQAAFGSGVALSADGNTLVVGSSGESSNATGINGNQTDTSTPGSGAVYVFTRSGTTWSQVSYVKASNTALHSFGSTVALSGDATTLAVGASGDSSDAVGINGNETDTSAFVAGAVYVFALAGTTGSQQAYVKASNTTTYAYFGDSLALSNDGSTLAVGADGEPSGATGVNGDQSDTSAHQSGAVYVFTRSGTTWSQEAYVKASNTSEGGRFGCSVALSSDGNTLAAGAFGESSRATGIDGNQSDTSAGQSGAAYLFQRAGASWSQAAYVKASNTRADANFGDSIALSGGGNTLAVGATLESSDATGVDGDQQDGEDEQAGAAYVFAAVGSGDAAVWSQVAYVKSSNTVANESFGSAVALSHDGTTLACGALNDSSDATGINGDETNGVDPNAGAVFVFQ